MFQKRTMDMLHGKLAGKLIRFALPIAASSMFQQLFQVADTAVVGRFADADALAAVGTNGEIVALLVSLSLGLAIGVNVLLAQLIGSGRRRQLKEVIHTTLGLGVMIGIFGACLGQWVARPLLMKMQTPPEVLGAATDYLKIYFLGYPALLVYDFGSAVLRARGDSQRPFLILVLSGAVNVGLNVFFVIACKMSVCGVAIATDVSNVFAAVLVIGLLRREEEEFQLQIHKCRIHGWAVAAILKIGIPAALQGAVFCFANIFVQASVNGFGASATAGSAIAMNFEYFGYYMITAFGQAATTFTSQNAAAGYQRRCRKILWLCLCGAILSGCIIIAPLVIFQEAVSGIFSSDGEVIRQACLRIRYILFFEPICGLYEIPAGYLRGTGYSAVPAVLTIVGTCMLRIVWIATMFRRINTLPGLFVIFPISWGVTILLMWLALLYNYNRRKKLSDICNG